MPADTPPPASRLRRAAEPLGLLVGAVAAFGYVGAVDPNQPGHYPVCPLLAATGVFCPGCGGLRSAHAVAHGDLATALGANALAVAGYAAFALFLALWLVRALRPTPAGAATGRGRAPGARPRPACLWLLGALVLAFTVVRNLPFGSGLTP
ncbi:DUF2752 domain-containing protein [Streptomyces sp. H27-D2]|uniref:DUF2752 domain-containing protein n=1 Tax=Streptomyces sp. H27-D2 TaxID=3046304 RepID=UPI002DB965BE|nr:DUF2752 domain-containing protein [Streptomyces sp. H27-D2]MEC4020260.1 DUF2752 domain-containing protein [Streptomyces sp. H27-D2]